MGAKVITDYDLGLFAETVALTVFPRFRFPAHALILLLIGNLTDQVLISVGEDADQ
jgi:hypothetical protein